MSTVQDVFDIAVRLMDAQNESTGSTDTVDTKEYRLRTPSLLNSILDRAYPASDNYPASAYGVSGADIAVYGGPAGVRRSGPGGERSGANAAAAARPVCPKVSAMGDEIGLDERLCTGVLPYGLAGLLLAEENPTLANFFWQTFLEQLEAAGRSVPRETGYVEDVHGVFADCIEFGRFSRW